MTTELDFDPILDLGFDPGEARGKQRHHLEALADHLDLLNWVSTSGKEEVRDLYSTMLVELPGRTTIRKTDAQEREARRAYADEMVKATLGLLNSGSSFYVAPSMVTMMEAASAGLPDDTPMVPEDLPSPHGFVRFGRPIDLNWADATAASARDREGMQERPTPMRVRGFAWFSLRVQQGGKTTEQVHTLWLAHREDGQDPIVQAEWLVTKDLDLLTQWLTVEDVNSGNIGGDQEAKQRLITELLDDPSERERRWRQQPRWLLDGHASWTVGKPVSSIGITAKVATGLFLLLQQRIGYVKGVVPPKRLDKQAQRRGLIPDIRVVTLRRRVPRNPGDERGEQVEVKWTHRWLVQGFWRNQYYPSEHRHRRIWIAPYVKGPEDLPLVVKDVVYAMER